MAKVLEGPGMALLKKWGMAVPNHVVVGSFDQFEALVSSHPPQAEWLGKSRLVIKAHEAIGSRMKQGLVKVNLNLKETQKAVREMLGKVVGSGVTVSQVIVSEMIEHTKEYYIAVKSTREGADLLLAGIGGIEIESHWDRVKHLTVQVGEAPNRSNSRSLPRLPVFPKNSSLPFPNLRPSSTSVLIRRTASILRSTP